MNTTTSKAFVNAVKDFLSDLATLRVPTTATAIAALIVELFHVHVSAVAVAGVLTGVGTGSSILQNFIWHKSAGAKTQDPKTVILSEVEKEVINAVAVKAYSRRKPTRATPLPEEVKKHG
jgi:CelD/BcsL family acetyltransferase involved in cellulose biosynthesis